MKSILLVDDAANAVFTVGVRIKSEVSTGFTAQDAINGASAVRKSPPDVVAFNLSLPTGDGVLVA